ncbi:MAG: hypothetical protein ABJN69_00570 [Hellea sp.]
MKIHLSTGLILSAIILASCGGGNKLSEKTALKLLKEKKSETRITQNMLTDYSAGHYQTNKIYYEAYESEGLIGKPPKTPTTLNNDLKLNTKKIKKKGWDKYLEFKPAGNDGQIVTIYNYTTRIEKVLRINTDPIDRLCNAVVEYQYEAFDHAPWGKDVWKKKYKKPTVYEACMIKYDKSWDIKSTRKTGR